MAIGAALAGGGVAPATAAKTPATQVTTDTTAGEALQPLPPVQQAGGSSGSLAGSTAGSSSPCTRLNTELAAVKKQWDQAVKEGDFYQANLLRIDYTNLAVSFYQCSLAKGSLL